MRCSDRPAARELGRALLFTCIAIGLLLVASPRAAHAEGFAPLDPYDANGDTFIGSFVGPVTVEAPGNGGEYAWYAGYSSGEYVFNGFTPGGGEEDPPASFPGGTTAGTIPSVSGTVVDNLFTASPWMFISVPTQNRVLAYERVYPSAGLGVDQSSVKQIPGPAAPGDAGAGSGDGQFNQPRGLAIGPEGLATDLYVADWGNQRIQVFDSTTLAYKRQIDNPGWSDYPVDPLAVDNSTGELYAGAPGVSSIDVFDAGAQNQIDTIFTNGTIHTMTIDQNAHLLYVGTAGSPSSIEVFSLPDRTPLGTFQLPDEDSDPAAEFAFIDSLSFEPSTRTLYTTLQNGSLYVAKPYAMQQLYCDDPAPVTVAPGDSITVELTGCQRSTSPRQYRVTQQPTNGTATVEQSPDQITYTASPSATGQDSFKFLAVDRYGGMAEKTLVINPDPPAQPVTPPPPANPPTYKEDANLSRSTGTILVKLPGSDQYVSVASTAAVPIGTIVDARDGVAFITWARPDGTTYSGQFSGGIFEIKQDKGKDPYAVVKLRTDLVAGASAARALMSAADSVDAYIARKKGKRRNRVWGNAKGKFRTEGSNSSASVRGTNWLVEDYANGTRTYVKTGVVVVKPYKKRKTKGQKTKTLKKGQSYFVWR